MRDYTRRQFLTGSLGLGLDFFTARYPAPVPQIAPPNIVLIVADDLGYGSLGCYGQQDILTPNLDALAASGRRFTQAYSAGCQCSPSRWSLMTGKHVGKSGKATNTLVLGAGQSTVTEHLKSVGYQTACIGKWGIGFLQTGDTPNDKGFDYFYGYMTHQEAHLYYPAYLWENKQQVSVTGYAPDLMTAKALEFISQAQAPFFLYLPYNLPHINSQNQQFEVPTDAPYSGMPWTQNEKNYAAMITRLDAYVGQIIQALPPNTIIIFTSDNGSDYPQMFQSNGQLRAGKSTLYEGGIRIPLIVTGPGIAPGVETRPAWQVNFLAMALSGDVGRLLEAGPMYWAYYGNKLVEAVRLGDFKGVRGSGGWELFDLASDVGETVNRAAAYPEIVAQMEATMGRYCPDPKICKQYIPLMVF